MHVLVMGAGAVGSYYGGRLAQAGHAVTLVARAAHADAIRRAGGLTIDSRVTGRHLVPIAAAVTRPGEAPPADLVLLTVKSYDTEAAARALATAISDGATVLSLQNGIDNHEIAARVLGDRARVAAAVVYVGARLATPGVVEHGGRGEIVLPTALAHLAPLFDGAGIPATTTDDIAAALWRKLLVNAGANAVGLLTGLPFGALAARPEARAVITAAVDEAARVAAAAGVRLPPADLAAEVLRTCASLGPSHSSTAQDVAAGKPTEIDALNGAVVRLGAAHGVPTPVNAALHALATLRATRYDVTANSST